MDDTWTRLGASSTEEDSPPICKQQQSIPKPPPPSPYSPFSTTSSASGSSGLSPIDMASLHSLSPGSTKIPGPPPPSPLNFNNFNPSPASTAVAEAGVTAAVVVAASAATSCTSKGISTSMASSTSGAGTGSVNGNKILKIGDSSSYNEKSPIRRFFIPPTLEKKHSSGDLHSRLKTRKMLGVGETDNGDIHRSKISQVLGHNEHLYLKLPRGYWTWQQFLSAVMGVQAIILILMPNFATNLGIAGIPPPPPQTQTQGVDGEANASVAAVTGSAGNQYYGAALLSFSFLLWKFLHVNDKMIIRATQFATLVHFSMLCTIDLLTILQYGFSSVFDKLILFMLGFRVTVCIVCYMYLRWLGLPSSGLRRSPSYKECSPPPTAIGISGVGVVQDSGGAVVVESISVVAGGYDKEK